VAMKVIYGDRSVHLP